MPRSTTVRFSALALAAAAALTACSAEAPAATTPTPSATTPTAEKTTSAAPVEPAAGKATGDNLLTWKDYSSLGIKGLTVNWTFHPTPEPVSACQTDDMRDAPDHTAFWQSTSKGKVAVLAAQQVASFETKEAAEEALTALAAWNKDCTTVHQVSAEVDLDGDAVGTYWKREIDDKRGEVVALTRIGKRVSLLITYGKPDAVALLDPEAIVAMTAVRLG